MDRIIVVVVVVVIGTTLNTHARTHTKQYLLQQMQIERTHRPLHPARIQKLFFDTGGAQANESVDGMTF